MTIEAVVFDLGGTLVEYAGAYERWPELETPGFTAAHDFLSRQDVALPAYDQFQATGFDLLPRRWQRATAGVENLRLVDLLAEVLHRHKVEGVEPAWLLAAAERYQAAVQAQAVMIDAAPETLAAVKAHGYKIGLISNTMFTGEAHKADLRRFGLIDYFDAMLFSADVNKWKPNPDPYWHVLAELAVPPAAAVFIGDDPANDVVGGLRAGLRTVYYRSSSRFYHPDGVEPHVEIRSLRELMPVLAQWQDGASG